MIKSSSRWNAILPLMINGHKIKKCFIIIDYPKKVNYGLRKKDTLGH